MKEWIRIFYEEYVCLNLKEFSNIGIDLEIGKIFLAGAIAIAICAVVLDLRHRCSYALIKQLLRHDALKEENAKTLTDLGLVNNRQLKRLLSDSGKRVVGEGCVRQIAPKMSSEDFSDYLTAVPGVFFRIGTAISGRDTQTSAHNNDFVIDESALHFGADTFVQFILDNKWREI